MPLRRTNVNNVRDKQHPNQFYPIYVNTLTNTVEKVGESLSIDINVSDVPSLENCETVLPIRDDGTELMWGISRDKFIDYLGKGYIHVSRHYPDKPQRYAISYLTAGEIRNIANGDAIITGHRADGSVIAISVNGKPTIPSTQWDKQSHEAQTYGTGVLSFFLPERKFPFPKSLYAVEDCLKMFLINKPNALVVDFFAGSGTTAHATMLLNHLDGGHRRSVMVTNNEIGPDAEKDFIENKKLRPSDGEWQKYGIANYITWERIKSAITGIATDGEPVKGDYRFTEVFPMSEGFKENAVFCELTYENLWDIRLDRAFNAIAPILWAVAGCKGTIIEKLGKGYATTKNYAVLFKYDAVSKFVETIKKNPSIEHVFVVTDDQTRYTNIVKRLYMMKPENIHRLYEGYLKSFEIVGEGGLD